MATFRGMKYTEHYDDGDGPRIAFAPDGARCQRKFYLDYATHYKASIAFPPPGAIQNLVGVPQVVEQVFAGAPAGTLPFRYISRAIPMQDPVYSNLFVGSIPAVDIIKLTGNVVGNTPGSKTGDYETALAICEFRSYLYDIVDDAAITAAANAANPAGAGFGTRPPYMTTGGGRSFPTEGNYFLGIGPRRYITRFRRPASSIHTLRRGVMQHCVDQKPVPEGIPWREFRLALEYIWHDVPEGGVPDQFIAIAGQSLNAYVFDGFPVGTVLFDSATIVPTLSPIGQRLYQVKYLFYANPNIKRLANQPAAPDFGYDGNPIQANTPTGWNSILDYATLGFGAGLGQPLGLDYWRVSYNGANPFSPGNPLLVAPNGETTNANTFLYRLSDHGRLFMPDQFPGIIP